MIKVSVIVPVYNVEQYLGQCLDSIVNQSLKEIEIICVNDGSTDKSGEILNQYANADPRIVVIDKENSGYGHSMNVGMLQAKGEYIGIVESDDFIRIDMYEVLYNQAKKFDLDIIKADYMQIYNGTDNKVHYYQANIVTKKEDYNRVIDSSKEDINMPIPFVSWSGIYRRTFLYTHHIRHNETPGASYQDVGFCTLTTLVAKRMMYYPEAFYCYRVDNPNASVKSKEKIYCVFEEYDFVKQYLIQYTMIYPKYRGNLVYRTLLNYIYSMQRIDECFIEELVFYMQDYIKKSIDDGIYNEKWFVQDHKNLINEILYNPRKATEIIIQRKGYREKQIDKLQELLERCDSIIVYGAGVIGKHLLKRLALAHLAHKVSCYAVTKRGNEGYINGIEVKGIDEIKQKDALIIIAISSNGALETIEQMIKQVKLLGFNYVLTYEEILNV